VRECCVCWPAGLQRFQAAVPWSLADGQAEPDACDAVSPSPRCVDLVFMELALCLAYYAMRSTLADASLDVLHARARNHGTTHAAEEACLTRPPSGC
jgi:hypothetical protein